MKRLARKSALSSKAAGGQLVVVEDFSFEAPKTKAYKSILSSLQLTDKKSLLVTADYEKEVYLSCRNLQRAAVVRAADLNTYQIMNGGTLVLSESAVSKIIENLDR